SWNGTTLLTSPETYSVSDAGSLYVSNTLYLPSDSLGKSGYITQITETEESVKNSESEFRKDSIVVMYKWNNVRGIGKADTVLTSSRTYISKEEEF
ncbi:MAG: hypothetical protein H7259_10960, partial [Cytophagales bacterium]|nr:hypothetical protein [Cytophaga sp.]